jgi:hypothetical protein
MGETEPRFGERFQLVDSCARLQGGHRALHEADVEFANDLLWLGFD